MPKFILALSCKFLSIISALSCSYKQHVSLDKFWGKFHKNLTPPYILYTKDLEVRKTDYAEILHLPLYMAGLI